MTPLSSCSLTSLELKLEGFEDPDTAKPKAISVSSSLKSKLGTETSAYKTVGTTAFGESKVFLILQDYLQPDSETSHESAVQSILPLIPDNASLSDEVYLVGLVCLELAEQIPYHHPSQIKLARVVEELSRSAKFTDTADGGGMHFRFFCFKEALRDWYSGPDEENPNEWSNINAFFANERSSHIRPHGTLAAVWTMRDAFEVRQEDVRDSFERIQNQQDIAAAQHILWDGQGLFKHVICPRDPSLENRRSLKPGPLYKSDQSLTLDRWRFWQRGFQAAAENGRLSEECRNIAARASNLMEVIDQNMLFQL